MEIGGNELKCTKFYSHYFISYIISLVHSYNGNTLTLSGQLKCHNTTNNNFSAILAFNNAQLLFSRKNHVLKFRTEVLKMILAFQIIRS
jgi:hypothetical protein